MNLFNEVVLELLGNYKLSFYIAYSIFVFLGVIAHLRVAANKRDKTSPNTPFKFSWGFLLRDNAVRVFGSMTFVFLSIRLGQDLFNMVPEYYTAVLMGFSFDFVLAKAEKWQYKARKI